MRIGLVAAATALLLLATGCGAADPAVRLSRAVTPPVATSPAPAPPLRLSYAELVAALPLARDLYPWTVTVRCLTTRAECGHFLDGNGAVLIGAGATSQEVRERLMLGVLRWPR